MPELRGEKRLSIRKEKDASGFYGAVRSKNEIYFQMASVFKAVSRDENRLAGEWMTRILAGNRPEISGKKYGMAYRT